MDHGTIIRALSRGENSNLHIGVVQRRSTASIWGRPSSQLSLSLGSADLTVAVNTCERQSGC